MKILFANKRILFPTDTGGLVRTLNIVRHLAQWHDVTYLCSLQPGQEAGADQMRELGLTLETVPWREVPRDDWRFYRDLAWNLLSRDPFNAAKDFDPALRRRAAELLAAERFDLIVCDFVQMARNILGLGGPPAVLFQHNVEAEIFERHARTDAGWIRRQFMGYQASKMRAFEAWAGPQFARVIAVSDRDRAQFFERYGWSHVDTIDTAVDIDHFVPAAEAEAPESLVFVGSLDWLPNQDGLTWFVHEVWPLIRARVPGAVFRIVGRNPSKLMRTLAETPGIDLVGGVPDTRPWLTRSSVVVVPLRIGGGTRLKVFEAMAMGKPVVSTTLGAEGLAVESGNNIVLADGPGPFAESVVGLLQDSASRTRMGESARRLVEEKFSSQSVARQFEQVCVDVAGVPSGPVASVARSLK